ncbi:MAG: YjjG family noncanonical pyrimidine nucleotidase [Muribaculaceae bacterium]|nr:YjjG family noncanonical pyrimidine nucleotidase [Muribaculaceae bacterium]
MSEANIFDGVTTVFVDLDDTLWWFTANSRVALAHTYAHFHIERWEPAYSRFEHIYETRNSALWHDYHHGRVTRDYLLVERFRYVLEQVGCNEDCTALSRDMNAYYLDDLATLPTLVPGARDLLQALRAHGLEVNVLSNGFAGVQQRKLRSGGIESLIDHVVLSDDCGITKPQRGIFEYAQRVCGCEAARTLMIGDDPDTDIAGAHAAGWRTIYFNAKCREAVPGTADVEVASLTQVTAMLTR